jgi:hypothetical protein
VKLLLAQARTEGRLLLTVDASISQYQESVLIVQAALQEKLSIDRFRFRVHLKGCENFCLIRNEIARLSITLVLLSISKPPSVTYRDKIFLSRPLGIIQYFSALIAVLYG